MNLTELLEMALRRDFIFVIACSFSSSIFYFLIILTSENFLGMTATAGSGREDGFCEHSSNRGSAIRLPKEKFLPVLTL